MKTTAEIRRANALLFLALTLFAIALALTVFFWMRVKVRANGGVVDPVGWMQLESGAAPV